MQTEMFGLGGEIIVGDMFGTAGDIVVGAEAIARATGFKARQVFYLASKGELPGVFRLGAQLAMSQSAYRAGLAAKIAAASAVPLAA